MQYEFIINEKENCPYPKAMNNDCYSLSYVDVKLIFGTKFEVIFKVKEYLSRNFDMKAGGPADILLV